MAKIKISRFNIYTKTLIMVLLLFACISFYLSFNSLFLSADTPPTSFHAYYVSKTGLDSNSGEESAPFLTIHHGLSVMVPGDTLLIGPGIYGEDLNAVIPSGVDANSPTTLQAYDPDNPPTLQAQSSVPEMIKISGSVHHITLENLILDGNNLSGQGIYFANTASNNIVRGLEIKNNLSNGLIIEDQANNNQFLSLNVHNNGTTTNGAHGHGFYMSSNYNLIKDCSIHDNAAWGVQVYNGYANRNNNNVIQDNRIYNHPNKGGVVIGEGDNTIVQNNVIWNDSAGVQLGDHNDNTHIFNNTIVTKNTNVGVWTSSQTTNAEIINNIIWVDGGYAIYSTVADLYGPINVSYNLIYNPNNPSRTVTDTAGLVISNNNIIGQNPLLVDPINNDYRLQSTSPVVDRGLDLNIPLDFNGKQRFDLPGVANNGSIGSYDKDFIDIGAFEYITPVVPNLSSSTHPIQNDWYSNKVVELTASPVTSTTTFKYLIDQNISPDISEVMGGIATTSSVFNTGASAITDDGIWYIHVLALNLDGDPSATFSTYTVKIDTTAPVISQIGNKSSYPGRAITFSAQVQGASLLSWEKASGLGEIVFGSASLAETTVAANSIGVYSVRLVATDSAGNSSQSEITLKINRLGDINGDDKVGFADFTFLLANWGDGKTETLTDINNDASVNFTDFTLLLANWGN